MQILVVDDEQQIRGLLTNFLKSNGHASATAANGREAWQKFSADPRSFDLIITDIKMPDMDGLELLARIRNHNHDVPVVIMTAYAEMDFSLRALQLGAFDFIIKPFEWTRLKSIFTNLETLRADQQEIQDILPYSSAEYNFRIPGRMRHLKTVTQFLQQNLAPFYRLYGMDSARYGLAMMEAMTNGMIHGNFDIDSSVKERSWEEFTELIKEREGLARYAEKKLLIQARIDPDSLVFSVTDEGQGFDYAGLPDFTRTDGLRTSGRGLLLIHTTMDRVEWNQSGNRITMTRFLSEDD
ncbi:MAG: response regulator [Leptospiraceae bacterium]|nr:response regulator [Leptospiraceae bacterium]